MSGGRVAVFAGIVLVLINRALLRLRLRRRLDGWRRGAGLVLRDEPATFVLSAFALDVWSDDPTARTADLVATEAHLIARLKTFLERANECHIRVTRMEFEDVTTACVTPAYSVKCEPWVGGCERFVRPDRWNETARGDDTRDVLSIVARVANDGSADVWFRINHVATDGVPMQQMISRPESEWGTLGPVKFPTPSEFAPHVRARDCRSTTRNDLCEMQTFIDFAPLLTWRKRMNESLPEPMTISAAFMWCLSAHPAFAHIRIGTTVDVPAIDGLGRGVGVVVIRPSDYAHRADGLAAYAREFNRQIELTRTRCNDGAKTLDACAHLPPRLANTLLRYALEHDDRAFGSMGVTVLKDAKVFGAPLGDAGHRDGFIAIGSMGLPTSDGRTVGCVTIKGRRGVVERYPVLVREAVSTLVERYT